MRSMKLSFATSLYIAARTTSRFSPPPPPVVESGRDSPVAERGGGGGGGGLNREVVRAAMYKLVANDNFIDLMVKELKRSM